MLVCVGAERGITSVRAKPSWGAGGHPAAHHIAFSVYVPRNY